MFVVHRIDRGASGLVLIAKTSQAHRFLSVQFERREVKKTYLVLVQGILDTGGRIDHSLRAFGSGRIGVSAAGKPSVTEFQVRERLKGATLLEVTPLTGRRHQIRVHLFSLGHPVMGDPLYGKDRPVGGAPRLMLHAFRVKLEGNGDFKADLPDDFLRVLDRFRAG